MIFVIVFFAFPDPAHADKILEALRDKPGVFNMWRFMLNAVNSLVVVVLIVVAFAEILRINVNTYGLKKILPTLVFAVIAANFSFMFCKLIIGISNVAMTIFRDPVLRIGGTVNPEGTSTASAYRIMLQAGFPSWKWSDIASGGVFFPFIFRMIVALAVLIGVTIITILLLVRVYFVQFLVVLTPIAFMAMVLPQTKNLFKKWWDQFIKWTFMPVLSTLFLWLGARFSDTYSSVSWFPFVPTLIALGCIWAAILVPFKLGGGIMSQWNKLTGIDTAKNWAKRTGSEYWDGAKASLRNQFFSGNSRYRALRWVGKKYGKPRADRGADRALARQLPKLQEEHRKNEEQRNAALRRWNAKPESYWSDPINRSEAGRVKSIMRGGVLEEGKSVSYKNSPIEEIFDKNVITKKDGTAASAREVFDAINNSAYATLLLDGRSADVIDKKKTSGKSHAVIYEEHAASYNAIVGASRTGGDRRGARTFLQGKPEIKTDLDLATMGVTPVGKDGQEQIGKVKEALGERTEEIVLQSLKNTVANIGNLIDGAGLSIDPSEREDLISNFERIHRGVNDLVDQEMIGMNFVFHQLKERGGEQGSLANIQEEYKKGVEAMSKNQLQEAMEIAQKLTGTTIEPDKLESYYGQIGRGIDHFKLMDHSLLQALPQQEWEGYKKTVQEGVQRRSLGEYTARTTLQDLARSELGTASLQKVMTDSGALNQLTEKMEQLNGSISRMNNLPHSPLSTGEIKTMIAHISGGDLSKSLSTLFRDERTWTAFSRTISGSLIKRTTELAHRESTASPAPTPPNQPKA